MGAHPGIIFLRSTLPTGDPVTETDRQIPTAASGVLEAVRTRTYLRHTRCAMAHAAAELSTRADHDKKSSADARCRSIP